MGFFDFFRKHKKADKGESSYVIAHPENYDAKEKEVIVLTRDSAGTVKIKGEQYASATIRLLAYIDTATGELVEKYTVLKWDLTESEAKQANRKHGLKAETCYRLLVRESFACTTHWGYEMPAGRSLFVTKVLERSCRDERLEKVLEEYRRPRSLTLSDGTVLDFCPRYNWYSGEVEWLKDSADVMLNADEEEFANADEAVKIFEQILSDKAGWDKKAREFAAKELTGLANDWQDQSGEEDCRPITRADFARRIGCPGISVQPDGSIEFSYGDDDMFWGHIIVVDGSIDEGFTGANIEG